MVVQGIDYNILVACEILQSQSKDSIVQVFVFETSGLGITDNNVSISLSPGSVRVQVVINVPVDSATATVHSVLSASASSGTIGSRVAEAVVQVPGINVTINGVVSGSGFDI